MHAYYVKLHRSTNGVIQYCIQLSTTDTNNAPKNNNSTLYLHQHQYKSKSKINSKQ